MPGLNYFIFLGVFIAIGAMLHYMVNKDRTREQKQK